jgi:hypothetical protein
VARRRRRSVRSEEKALLNSDSNHGRRSRKMKATARRRPLVVVVLVAAASLPAGLMTRWVRLSCCYDHLISGERNTSIRITTETICYLFNSRCRIIAK